MSDATQQKPVATDRDAFNFFESITLRYADNDLNGHVNNAHYYAFFDTAVEGFLRDTHLRQALAGEGFTPVVASSCRYFREIAYPGDISVGVKLARLGRTSLTYELAIFTDGDNQTAAATGTFTTVCTDKGTRRPTAIPQPVRDFFESQH